MGVHECWKLLVSGRGSSRVKKCGLVLRLPARWASASLATASNVSSGFINVYMWLCKNTVTLNRSMYLYLLSFLMTECRRQLKSSFIGDTDHFADDISMCSLTRPQWVRLCCRCYCCWFSDNVRSQDIRSHYLTVVLLRFSILAWTN